MRNLDKSGKIIEYFIISNLSKIHGLVIAVLVESFKNCKHINKTKTQENLQKIPLEFSGFLC